MLDEIWIFLSMSYLLTSESEDEARAMVLGYFHIKSNFYIKEVTENVVGVLFSNDQLLSNVLGEVENNSSAT
jgi:hypothetical protein